MRYHTDLIEIYDGKESKSYGKAYSLEELWKKLDELRKEGRLVMPKNEVMIWFYKRDKQGRLVHRQKVKFYYENRKWNRIRETALEFWREALVKVIRENNGSITLYRPEDEGDRPFVIHTRTEDLRFITLCVHRIWEEDGDIHAFGTNYMNEKEVHHGLEVGAGYWDRLLETVKRKLKK